MVWQLEPELEQLELQLVVEHDVELDVELELELEESLLPVVELVMDVAKEEVPPLCGRRGRAWCG